MSSKSARKKTTQKQVSPRPSQTKQRAPSTPVVNASGAEAKSQYKAETKPSAATADRQALAEKRDTRMQRQSAAREAAARRRQAQTIRRYALIGAAVVVLIGLFAVLYWRDASRPGESVPAMASRQHIAAGATSPLPYNTDPPTNGPHVDAVPEFKIYSEPITKELAVHGLEDGAVIINYQPELDKPTVDKLAAIATSYLEIGGGRGRVVMAPYPGLSHPVVLTAWQRIDRLQALDEPRIRRFVDEYAGIDNHEGAQGRRIP